MKNIFELRSGLAHYKPAISTGNTMPNYRRDYTKGGTYFITAVLQDRRCDWLTRHITAFRTAWQETASRYPTKPSPSPSCPNTSTPSCNSQKTTTTTPCESAP